MNSRSINLVTFLVLALSLASAVHIEISRDLIRDSLHRDKAALEQILNDGLHDLKISFDEDTFELGPYEAPNSINFQLKGSVTDQLQNQHLYTVHSKLNLSRSEWSIFKNELHSTVKVVTSTNHHQDKLQTQFEIFNQKLANWTHQSFQNATWQGSSIYIVLNFVLRSASFLYNSQRALYLDYSTSDLQFLNTHSDVNKVYDKTLGAQRYFGISLNDSVINEDIMIFLFSLVSPLKLRTLIPQQGKLAFLEQFLHMSKLDILFPDVAEEYGLDRRIDIQILNKTHESKESVHHNNKITFKKDSIEFLTGHSFLINLENNPQLENKADDSEDWKLIRKGSVIFRFNLKIVTSPDSDTLTLIPQGVIKEISMLNPENDDEQMEIEEGGVKGLTNLVLKKILDKLKIKLSDYYKYLACAQFEKKLSLNMQSGLLQVELFRMASDTTYPSDCINGLEWKELLTVIQRSFLKIDQSNKNTYEREQREKKQARAAQYSGESKHSKDEL